MKAVGGDLQVRMENEGMTPPKNLHPFSFCLCGWDQQKAVT